MFTEIIVGNNLFYSNCFPLLPFSKARTKAMLRIGPHNLDILSIIICGLLGDFWSHLIPSRHGHSVRFQLEQSVSNSAYIHSLNLYLYNLGYCASFVPKLVKKSESKLLDKRSDKTVDRFNYRLTLFTFTSFIWIHEGFYTNINGINTKIVPKWIAEFITPLGLAHLVMQVGFQKEDGLILKTNLNNISDLNILKKSLFNKYNIDSQIIFNQDEKVSIFLNKSSWLKLSDIIALYIPAVFSFLLLSSESIPSLQLITKNKRDKVNYNLISPLKIYLNADICKELVITDNKDKSGIYRWTNIESGKSYIGSSSKLNKRFTNYYNYNYIINPKRNMLIHKALLKYGYSTFRLEILEYCNFELLIEREQYYIDLLKPEYNILPIAGSSLGFKHSSIILERMKNKN